MGIDEQQRNRSIYISMAFSLLVFLVYSPLLGSSFINYDDPLYVTGNEYVKAGITLKGISWAFTSIYSYNWHPLTWISHMLDVQLFGMNPQGHHLTSVLFHLANSLLLFALLRKLTGTFWQSLCAAALFALHPLHVQSVAWISERKDVLSTFFLLLAIWAYVGYAKSAKIGSYLALLFYFAFGLMAKPMLITLPFVLLLLDYWPLGRLCPNGGDAQGGAAHPDFRRLPALLLEKIPLLALTVASSIITYLAQKKGGALAQDGSSALSAGNALMTYLSYLKKTVWPSGLSVYYPFDPGAISTLPVAGAGVILLAASIAVIWGARSRPYLATGWFWYLVTLVPVIGFVRIGQHAMADRYTYVPLIGIFIMVAWGAGDLAAGLRLRKEVLLLAAALLFIPLSFATWLQAGHWHNSITLFKHSLAVTDNNWVAHKNLATALAGEGNLQEALLHVGESLRIKPDPSQYVSQGWLLAQLGEYEKSVESCRKALSMAPDNERAHFLLGVNHVSLKNYPSAMAEYSYLQNSGSRFAVELMENLKSAGITTGIINQ